ncbi:helix-turn-helix transcriptional regulator [Oceanobacillus sp. CAU 1775]
MENTLKITNVMSDPTRFDIYQHLIEKREYVNVNQIAKLFDIHPNVARLHLSKLEDIKLVASELVKTGKGGRPGRQYRLSDKVVELNFPARDYKILSSIALESLMELGEPGKQALYQTGKKYGIEAINNYTENLTSNTLMEDKIIMLEDAGRMLGMYPTFTYNEETNSISFSVNNCPFKEVAHKNHEMICDMHHSFLKGMFEALFTDIELIEQKNMFLDDCSNCAYIAKLTNV